MADQRTSHKTSSSTEMTSECRLTRSTGGDIGTQTEATIYYYTHAAARLSDFV